MKLKTSCYDPALGRMELRRFAPVWLLYTIGLFLLFFATVTTKRYNGDAVLVSFQGFHWITAIYSCFFAPVLVQLLFGDLYTSRLSYGLRSLPITRGGWFGTQVILGIAGSLIPNALLALVMPLRIHAFRQIILWWFCASQLQFLFFFGAAILCAICAGNRFGQILLYGIVNVVYLLGMFGMIYVYVPLLYGVQMRNESLFLAPVFHMADEFLFDFQYNTDYQTPMVFSSDGPVARVWQDGSYIEGVTLTKHMGELAIYAAIGCAAIALAMYLYRRRKAECAGDLLAFPKMEPAFLVICTLCAGMVFVIAAYIFNRNLTYPMMAIGIVLGYYACLMLLRRKVNVFTRKSLLPLLLICALVVTSLTLTGLDVFGIARKVPKAEDVDSISVNLFANTLATDDPEDIAAILEIQQQAIAEHEEIERSRPLLERIFGWEDVDAVDYDELSGILVLYFTAKNGTVTRRDYAIHESSPGLPQLKKMMSRPEVVFHYALQWLKEGSTLPDLLAASPLIQLQCNHASDELHRGPTTDITTAEDRAGLMEAILADCAEGSMAQAVMFRASEKTRTTPGRYTSDNLTFYIQSDFVQWTPTLGIDLSSDCTHTYQWLTDHGFHDPELSREILNP